MSPWVVGIGEAMGLAAVALIGYMFGRRTRTALMEGYTSVINRELDRAALIASRLETIADSLRQSLANHHAQVLQFKRRLRQLREIPGDESWRQLCDETENVLVPTMALANLMTQAYEQIRQQSQELATFTTGRLDPLTGFATVQALEKQIELNLRCQQSNQSTCSIAMLTADLPVDRRPTRRELDRTLKNIAHLLQRSVRGSDFLVRYSTEEFAVLLPNTTLHGADQFAQRIRKLIREQLELTISIGLAVSMIDDDAKSLLSRADSALYSARAAGGDEQFAHNGVAIRSTFDMEVSMASDPAHPEQEKRSELHATSEHVNESLDHLSETLIEAQV